jgi:transposase
MEIDTIGIDLGKTVFHLVGLNAAGEVVVRRKFSRPQLLRFTVNLRVRRIGMEACGGSHFLGRSLREQGHEVRLMPAQYVKPYVKRNKNDYIDAEAIAEAVGRAKMRFVRIKSDDQLDMQSLHRVRDRWVGRRTSVINQLRGLLLERGITFRKGRRHAEASLPGILEDAENGLSGPLCMLLAQLQCELRQLQSQIDEADTLIARAAGNQEPCRRLMAIPGIGPLTATAVVAAIGNGAAFAQFTAISRLFFPELRFGVAIPFSWLLFRLEGRDREHSRQPESSNRQLRCRFSAVRNLQRTRRQVFDRTHPVDRFKISDVQFRNASTMHDR